VVFDAGIISGDIISKSGERGNTQLNPIPSWLLPSASQGHSFTLAP
jgi:hypothetical protein